MRGCYEPVPGVTPELQEHIDRTRRESARDAETARVAEAHYQEQRRKRAPQPRAEGSPGSG